MGAAEGVTPIRSRYAQLTVLVPPDPPMIFPLGETYKTVEGREVELRCESHGGKPASEVRNRNTVVFLLLIFLYVGCDNAPAPPRDLLVV